MTRRVIAELSPIMVKVYVGTVPGATCPPTQARYVTTVKPADRVATGGSTPTVSAVVDATPPPVVAPSNTPDPTTAARSWLTGQAFMDALSAAGGYAWGPGRARVSMTVTDATGVTITVTQPFDAAARVVIAEVAADAPTSGAFEAALGVVSPDDVGWLAETYSDLATDGEKVSASIDVTGGSVRVSHEVSDGVSTWSMNFLPTDWMDPELYPGE